jgi:glycosyltransferase involved in cell wall biosynthesis
MMRTRRAVLRRMFGRRQETLGWWALLLNLGLREAVKVLSRRETARDRAALVAALGARRAADLPPQHRGAAAVGHLRTLAVLHLAEAGGPAQHVRPWLAALADRGSLEVVVPGEGSARALYVSLGETSVLSYEPLMLPRSFGALVGFAGRFVRETWSFFRHFKRKSPDLVVVVTSALPAALLAARLRRIPVLVGVAEIFEKGHVSSRFRTITGALTARFTERLAHGLVCWSETIARQFRSGSTRPIVATVYPGVTPGRLAGERERFRQRHGLTSADPCLAVLGNLTRGRGQEVVIRALPGLQATFPNVACIVAGTVLRRPADLAYECELRRLVERLGLENAVAFVGFVDPVEDVYAAADIVVNPALFNEPLGRVALEALAAQRPVVASRVGGIPEVLRDGVDALLVEPNDPRAIAAAVTHIWTDAELRTRLVASGLAHVRALFDERAGVEAFLRVVDEVLVRNGRPRQTA